MSRFKDSRGDDWFSTGVTRRVVTKPLEDHQIDPKVLHRIKTYIGTDRISSIAQKASFQHNRGGMSKFGNLAKPGVTNTKIELVCTVLAVKGYTLKSISDNSQELFGVKLSIAQVRSCYKKIIMNRFKQKHFLNKIYEPNAGN